MMVLSRHYVRNTLQCVKNPTFNIVVIASNLILVVFQITICLPTLSNILFLDQQFYYTTCVIGLLTLCNKVTHVV